MTVDKWGNNEQSAKGWHETLASVFEKKKNNNKDYLLKVCLVIKRRKNVIAFSSFFLFLSV